MQVFVALRVLRWRGYSRSIIDVTKSIIAGGRHSNNYARCLTQELLQAMHRRLSATERSRSWVEDITMLTVAAS